MNEGNLPLEDSLIPLHVHLLLEPVQCTGPVHGSLGSPVLAGGEPRSPPPQSVVNGEALVVELRIH